MPFNIKSCDLGGAIDSQENAGADELKKIIESTTKDQHPVRIAIFDGDTKGQDCFRNLKKHNKINDNDRIKINLNKRSGAIILPHLEWGSPYDIYISDSHCIEMMFPYHSIPEEHIEFHFFMGPKKLSRSRGDQWIDKIESSPDLFEDIPFRVAPRFPKKINLAQYFSNLDVSNFEYFKLLFEDIYIALSKTSDVEDK